MYIVWKIHICSPWAAARRTNTFITTDVTQVYKPHKLHAEESPLSLFLHLRAAGDWWAEAVSQNASQLPTQIFHQRSAWFSFWVDRWDTWGPDCLTSLCIVSPIAELHYTGNVCMSKSFWCYLFVYVKRKCRYHHMLNLSPIVSPHWTSSHKHTRTHFHPAFLF